MWSCVSGGPTKEYGCARWLRDPERMSLRNVIGPYRGMDRAAVEIPTRSAGGGDVVFQSRFRDGRVTKCT
ncbi:hypothetical protein NJ7G_1009 [Natrinema sp. J7-2]|nr:hypothetical protein NJ7G_1009 [Natrinema sp. J7-2]